MCQSTFAPEAAPKALATESWRNSSLFDERQRAVLAYAEVMAKRTTVPGRTLMAWLAHSRAASGRAFGSHRRLHYELSCFGRARRQSDQPPNFLNPVRCRNERIRLHVVILNSADQFSDPLDAAGVAPRLEVVNDRDQGGRIAKGGIADANGTRSC